MFKNKAQIAQESIKEPRELPGPLNGPWTPAVRKLGFALVMCAPIIGVRDQFRVGGLRSVARIFSPLLARKSSGFARILPDFFCPNMAI